MTLPRIAVTMGDPAGIGPEVVLKAVAEPAVRAVCRPVAVASRAVLEQVTNRLSLSKAGETEEPSPLGGDPAAIVPGRHDAVSGALAAACFEHAIAGCQAGRFAAIATAPISKTAIQAAGIPFPGHTEWLAARCGGSGEVMMMHHASLAVALATVHQSLASVPASLTTARIVETGLRLAEALARLRGRPPRLAVLGLNPHAGEHGLFGDEDARLVAPAVAELLARGILVDGPLPPDTAFTPANRVRYDGFVCMYHDQGLIAFKALAFDEGVNVTLGLPVIRTSVDHGTAVAIAWQGVANHRSMVEAILLAAGLAAGKVV